MRTRERHLFFLQKTIELSNLLDKISFRAAPPTEICCLYSLDFRRSLSSYIKNLARGSKTHRDFMASWAPSRPENLVPLALKTYFLIWNSCQRSLAPSPVISPWFARVLASNVWETWIKMQSQRYESSPRLVKNDIMIHVTSFPKRVAPVCSILSAVGRFI